MHAQGCHHDFKVLHAMGIGRDLTSYEALLILFSFLFENSRGSCNSPSALVAALRETLIFNDILVSAASYHTR